MAKIINLLLMGLILSGCASHMENVRPEWNPQNGYDEAYEKCKEGAKYAWDKFGAYASCMAKYGYERRPGPKGPNDLSASR